MVVLRFGVYRNLAQINSTQVENKKGRPKWSPFFICYRLVRGSCQLCISVYTVYILYIQIGVLVAEGLFLSQQDSRPMYLQIMDQIKQKVRAGDWPAGHPLPSIRELSVATKVSVITVKRAYSELETEGVIVTQAGRGSFVADVINVQQQLSEAELQKCIDELLLLARSLQLGERELLSRVSAALAAHLEKA